MRKTVTVTIDLEDRSPENENWLVDTIALENSIQDRLDEVEEVTVHSITVTDQPYRLLEEVIVDLSINAGCWSSSNPNKMPDSYDSRDLVQKIQQWAREFKTQYPDAPMDDYYDKVDRFSERKMKEWAKNYTE